MYNRNVCAGCGATLGNHTSESQLYSPAVTYILCLPCSDKEDELVEEEGTNNIPRLILQYKSTMRQYC